jgi:hypothetical protein
MRCLRRAAIAALLLQLGAHDGLTASAPRVVRGPYLQPAPPGAALVVWYTDVPTRGLLEWRVEGGSWNQSSPGDEPLLRHEVLLDRLREGLHYQYRVVATGIPLANLSAETEFRFRVPSSSSIKLVSWGDSGTGTSAQKALASLLIDESPPPDLALVLGDVVYPSGASADYDPKFFAPYASILPRIPFYAAIGNHDYETRRGAAFLDVFSLPRNGPQGLVPETVYSFERGGALVLVHDSNLERAELVAAPWHRERVRESKARFRIAALHHSPYSSAINSLSAAAAEIRRVFPPLFAVTGVDLVLGAHDHTYERTRPLDGVVYVTTGAGGASLYGRASTHDYTAVFAGEGARPSYTVVDVNGANLQVHQKDSSGCVMDRLGIYKPLAKGDLWRVFPGAGEPPADWFQPRFSDRAWMPAAAPLGDLRRVVYARGSFALGPGDVDEAILRVRYDAGFVAYLNGVEVARRNVPVVSPHSGDSFESFPLPPSLLRVGTNVLSIEGRDAGDGGALVLAPELSLLAAAPGRCP